MGGCLVHRPPCFSFRHKNLYAYEHLPALKDTRERCSARSAVNDPCRHQGSGARHRDIISLGRRHHNSFTGGGHRGISKRGKNTNTLDGNCSFI